MTKTADLKPQPTSISQLQQSERPPPSPHTPLRTLSSNFNSPSASYRIEDEALVFEFGSRFFRAGFAGESGPRRVIAFGPRQSRRVGDYRDYLPGYDTRPVRRRSVQEWGSEYELWRMDLREVDLGLVEDRIERAVRVAYSKYLLLDSKSRRAVLVLPSVMPHALMAVILTCLFTNFHVPGITLFPGPVMSVVAAGLRAGLVVDIGWYETTVTAVCEYVEVYQSRTTRAMKLVTQKMAMALQRLSGRPVLEHEIEVDFEHAEEVTTRMGWCGISAKEKGKPGQGLEKVLEGTHLDDAEQDPMISVPLLSSSSKQTQIPFSTFRHPVESALLAANSQPRDCDDHEQTIPQLLYRAFFSLPPDVRGICMARIMITGGGSNIPGLKSRLMNELSAIVEQRGWDPIYGKAAENYRTIQSEIAQHRRAMVLRSDPPPKTMEHTYGSLDGISSSIPAALEPQVPDPIEEKLRREETKELKPTVAGVIRGVESLGSWVGTSLAAGLRIKGVVEIERETFLQQGLGGAKKEVDIIAEKKRQSIPGPYRVGPLEKPAWTLGTWA